MPSVSGADGQTKLGTLKRSLLQLSHDCVIRRSALPSMAGWMRWSFGVCNDCASRRRCASCGRLECLVLLLAGRSSPPRDGITAASWTELSTGLEIVLYSR